MWDCEESHPASPLITAGGYGLTLQREKGDESQSVLQDDNLRLRPTINVYFS